MLVQDFNVDEGGLAKELDLSYQVKGKKRKIQGRQEIVGKRLRL